MEKRPQDNHNKPDKKEEKFSRLSSALKKNLPRRKAIDKRLKKEKLPL